MEDAEDILESEEANEETGSSSTEENTHENRDEVKKLQADLLLLLALQPTVGFSLLIDFLPFRHFLTQFSPPSYSQHLYIFFDVLDPSFPWSSFSF